MSTMRATALLGAVLLLWSASAPANTYGSVEPIPSSAVLDSDSLLNQALEVREAFAQRAFQCGIVDEVLETLSSHDAVTTINSLNTRFTVGAGGFAGVTNPAYVYVMVDSGPNAASNGDIKVLTDSLAYVMSQGSAFLLDADNPGSFDFPANYVVLNFPAPPTIRQSAALFETVGRIDHALFATDSSGYTQYGRAYLSLQSFVPDTQFIAGYVRAAAEANVEYTPIVWGAPSLFVGGAAFPGNDWISHPAGDEYLSRIPQVVHGALAEIRDAHLAFTREALQKLEDDDDGDKSVRAIRRVQRLKCR
jgi:hypothetical protein